jgi:hypothetical protein
MRRREVPDEFRPTSGRFLSHPRGEIQTISPHCHAPTTNRQTTCSERLKRNSPNFASPEKRKKYEWGEIQEEPVAKLLLV